MIRRVLAIFILSRLIFIFFAFLAPYLIPLQDGYLGRLSFPNESYLVWIWANFDGRHFTDIILNGYRNFNFAFFPLYPLAVWVMDYLLFVDLPYVGIFVSSIFLLLSLIMVYKIANLDYRKNNIAWLSVLLMSFFPLSFFYNSMYSDSLFVLLSITSFYFARKGNWLLAGIFGGLTTLTRLAGIALLPALLVEWILQNKSKLRNWENTAILFWKKCFSALCLTFLGFLSYLIYLQLKYGNFLLFQESMVAWKQNEFVFPPQVVFRYLKIFSQVDMGQLVYWVAFLEFASMVFYFVLTYYVSKKVRLSYAVLMFFVLLLPTFTGTFAGMPRYILHAFPAFLGIAFFLSTRERFIPAMIAVFLILGFIFTGLFTRGYFIA